MSLPGLVVFSPLPPMPTGIGDYSFELLPLLARHYRCTVVAEDGVQALLVPPGVTLLQLMQYEVAEGEYAGQVHLYHLGNNPDHLYMLPVMARHPGVVVVHDPGLHHLLDQATAALGDVEGYGLAVEAEYGAPGRLLAAQWRAHELRDRQMLYEMPMLRQLLGPALHVLVHSRYAAHKVLREAPDTPVTIAPHLFSRPATSPAGAAMRQRLGIGTEEVVFLSLGFVSHIKRIDIALRALAGIARRLPAFRYVVAGAMRADELDVMGLARRLGIERQVLTTGYVAEEDFFPLIDMAEVVINLRYPVGGETSGTLIRAMGCGACCVVVDHGPFAELPEGAAIRLPWGAGFEAALADVLLRLAASPALRRQVGETAAREIGRRHHPDVALAAYRAAIDAAGTAAARPWRCGTWFRFLPAQQQAGSAVPLWRRAMPEPAADMPEPAADIPMLAIAGTDEAAALRALGHRPACPAPGWQPEAAAARAYELAFVAGAWLDLPDLPARLNRLLRFDGLLVLWATGGVFASRSSGEAALLAAGFRVALVVAAAAPGLAGPLEPAGDGVAWRAVKVSEFIVRGTACDVAA